MSRVNRIATAAGAEYHVVSTWTCDATREEIAEIFREPEALPQWWPAVFLAVRVDRPGGLYEVGQVAHLHTKGWLPYTLRFACRVSQADHPRNFTIAVDGDFEGRCVCTLRETGATVQLEFDWRVRVRKPVVRYLSPILKHVFAANHVWVMATGHDSLALELRRRRALRQGLDAAVPEPKGPTFRRWLRRRDGDRASDVTSRRRADSASPSGPAAG
jgi:hypothetical protein